MHTKMCSKEFYEGLDPGIRFPVKLLHSHGINTGQSCQGGEGHAYDRPTVDLWEDDTTTGFAALHYLRECDLPVQDIARLWSIDFRSGLPEAPFWRITFFRSMEDRADDWPMFVWGYEAETTDHIGAPADPPDNGSQGQASDERAFVMSTHPPAVPNR